jgi:hypothetical protein
MISLAVRLIFITVPSRHRFLLLHAIILLPAVVTLIRVAVLGALLRSLLLNIIRVVVTWLATRAGAERARSVRRVLLTCATVTAR